LNTRKGLSGPFLDSNLRPASVPAEDLKPLYRPFTIRRGTEFKREPAVNLVQDPFSFLRKGSLRSARGPARYERLQRDWSKRPKAARQRYQGPDPQALS